MAKQVRRRTQEERTEETRTRLLEAALKVMQRRGYSGFRTAEVAAVAGVSRGAQLHHFPSKESLVLATIEYAFNLAASEGRRRARRAASDIENPLDAIIEDTREFFFGDYFFVSLDVVMAAAKDKKFREKIFTIARESRIPVEQAWLDVLLKSGLSEERAEDLLWLTVSIVRGLAIRSLWQNDPERFDRLLDLWRELFWGYVKGQSSRARGPGGEAARRLPDRSTRKAG